MNYVITGGAGFIGSHLTEKLLLDGHEVTVIDNFNDYYDPQIKEGNINDIKSIAEEKKIDGCKFSIYREDIRNKAKIEEILTGDIDCVVHLAAMAGVRPSIEMPEYYYDVNITGTLNLLEACRKAGIKKFIFASSSSVYGNNKKVPFSESDIVDFPISPYAATKKSGELLCHTYHKLHNIDMACLRFFTVYGPRQRPDLAIHKFAKIIYNGDEIPFYGDGSSKRDYTYIDDIIDGVTKSIKWVETGTRVFEVFNLGESNTISLKDMVSTIEEIIGKPAKINRLPMQPGDVDVTYADVTKAKNMIGYHPVMAFDRGIRNFIAWYKEINNI